MPGIYTTLASRLIFPLQARAKGHTTVAVRRAMERSQWWTPQQLQAHQVERLRRLLVEAGSGVPYYRRLFAERGFDPAAVTDTAALQQLPFLTKAVIREHAQALKHEQAQHLSSFNTGGSSGEPLTFLIGRERVSHDVAAKWRATRWWGVDIGDPEIVVWGSPIELGAQDRIRAARDALLRTKLLPAFEMDEARLDRFVAEIRRMRPRMLFGYPSALSHIASHAEKRGIAMNDLGVRVAFVTSERLYDEQRATIERIFGCRVANGYGGRDAGFIAHQCPQGGMHLTTEDIVVEIVDAQGRVLPSGHSGEIVVTHLATRDYPFIRYRTGDMGVLDSQACPCGRGLPLLKEIHGRATDFVVAADGTVMHGLALVYILRELAGVRQFKIVQESLGLTRIQVVPEAGFDRANIETIAAKARARLGASVTVEVTLVDDIPPERSGKYRYVVSRVAPTATRETDHA